MNIRLIFLLLTISVIFSFGCNSDDPDGNGGDADADGDADGDSDSDADSDTGEPIDYCAEPITDTDEDGNLLIVAKDAYNYSFSSSLEIETVPVKSLSDIHFDWSGITSDMLGHDFDPNTSVDMMELMLWRYSKDELLVHINDDSLDTNYLNALGVIYTDQSMTDGNFLDLLSPSGSDVPDEELLGYVDTTEYPPEEYTYFIMVAEGATFGQGTKMITFFEPGPDETNTEVVMSNGSTVLNYEAELTSLQRIGVPPGDANIVLDWQDNDILLENAMGGAWIPTKITDVLVAHYEDKTPAELEARFLDLEIMADEMWSVFLSAGQSVNLSRLEDADGNAFTGIDDNGTWIVALKCGSCANPAPWFLSILQSCPQ